MAPGTETTNSTGVFEGAAIMHSILMAHPKYKAAWKGRTNTHFNIAGGVFSVSAGVHASVTRFQTEADAFDATILCESARWGDASRTPAFSSTDWLNNVNAVKNTWLPARRANMIAQLRSRGLMD